MPIHTIQVSEYECVHCGYRWINRVNGKDGPKPRNCAKCKRFHWNGKGEGYNPITPRERSLRVRLYKYEGYPDGRQYRPNALCEKFLSLNPRPTKQELYEALYPLKYDTYKNRHKRLIPDPDPNRPHRPGRINLKRDDSGWIPDPDREGWLKWNNDPNFKSDWVKTIEEETHLRREVMERVIKSRGEKVPKVLTEKEWQDARNEQLAKIMNGLHTNELNAKILELGRAAEAEGTPRHEICERMVKTLSDVLDKSYIERLCPAEWKPQNENE